MKRITLNLNSIFCVSAEMVKDNGEDCFCYETADQDFLVGAFDGCGGSGSKKYNNFSGKTGAYMASRAVCGGVTSWFRQSRTDSELIDYIQNALAVCVRYSDKAGRIMGSLGKAFPTTAAIIKGTEIPLGIAATCFWAGDSRCYMLDFGGLHQLTTDDLDDEDAMSNLTNDGVMTNVINTSVPFKLHSKKFVFKQPCILMSATDGCFGYLRSPMEFEYLLVDSLLRSRNISEWRQAINDRIKAVAGDDYTLCTAVYGYRNFEDIRNSFIERHKLLTTQYIKNDTDVQKLWNTYKRDYSIYL